MFVYITKELFSSVAGCLARLSNCGNCSYFPRKRSYQPTRHHLKMLHRCKEKSTGIQLGIEPGTFWLLSRTLLPLSHWTHGRGAEVYNSHAIGLSWLQLSLSLSPLGTLPSFKWRSPVDGVVGLRWIDCTGTLPERISLSTTPASGSITSQQIVTCSTSVVPAYIEPSHQDKNSTKILRILQRL